MAAEPSLTPLLLAGGGVLGGIALQLQQAALWSAEGYVSALVAGAVAFAVAVAARVLLRRRAVAAAWPAAAPARLAAAPARLAAAAAWLAAAALALAAFATTGLRAHLRVAAVLPAAMQGQDIEVTGVVARLPQSNLAGTRFLFDVEAATLQGAPVRLPALVSLGWYRGPDADALLAGPEHDVRAGQRWRLTVRLRQPHGHLNPHGFDYELWLFEQGVGATGYVRSRAGARAEKIADDAAHPVERLRQHLRERIEREVGDAAAAGVIAALAIGDQGAIDSADWDLFRITGVAHLMSISGLHVTMFAWLAGLAVGRAWRTSARLMEWLPSPLAARWGGLACAAAYALLAGWGVPAQRTVVMIGVVALIKSAGVRWPQLPVLLVAALAVTAIDPWAMLQPGFWLSFVAVALLIAAEPVHTPRHDAEPLPLPLHQRGWQVLRQMLRTQAVATVGLAPLTLVFFGQVSLVGFAANLVAIPLVTLLITPLSLLGVLVPLLWQAAAWLIKALLALLGALGGAPLAVWSAAAAPWWAAAAGLAGAALLALPLPWRTRLLGVPLLLPLLAPPLERPPPGRFEFVALDVGQGTAALVRTRHHLLVYDAGPQYSREADAGQRVLLPLLRARGETRIDMLMLSHRDGDHIGGAAALLTRLPVGVLASSIDAAHPLRALPAGEQQRCDAGQRWHWDGVDFEVLHPAADEHRAAARPNAVSCVLRVQGANGTLLLAGDIERSQEAALVERWGERLRSDVLVVPHHGSRTSSSAAFIDAVAPRIAVVQAGYRSRFGHPVADVVERYTARGITLVRSDACGAWTWSADGGTACQRQAAARYWHHGAGR